MKRILSLLDFSDSSLASYNFSLHMAQQIAGEVFAAHVIEFPMVRENALGIYPYSFDILLQQEAENNANTLFEFYNNSIPLKVPVKFKLIYDDIIPGLRTFIKQNKIDIIIAGAHDSTLDEFFVPSTIKKIMTSSPVPLLSIPRGVSFQSIKNIVFPNTLELNQKELIDQIKELQIIFGAKLHVLLVNTPDYFFGRKESDKRLEKFAAYYSLDNYTLNYRDCIDEQSGIISFLNDMHADMVAMATHGRTGLAHLIKGSIAELVSQRIGRPLWTWKINKTYNTNSSIIPPKKKKSFLNNFRISNSKKPSEIPVPGKDPEVIPAQEPEPTVWPKKDPEIKPEREPQVTPPRNPEEIPAPPQNYLW